MIGGMIRTTPMRAAAHVIVLIAALAIQFPVEPSFAQTRGLSGIGIVVLHGKGGTPTSGIEGLTESLRREGALVEAPELPWSARRIYDATYDQAMTEIDA